MREALIYYVKQSLILLRRLIATIFKSKVCISLLRKLNSITSHVYFKKSVLVIFVILVLMAFRRYLHEISIKRDFKNK